MRDHGASPGADRTAGAELRSVVNALRVLAELADADAPLAVTDLAARLRLPASTTHRILATLIGEGYAARVPALRRYRAGPALSRLGRRSLLDNARLQEAARPVLTSLAAESGETSLLAVLEGTEAVVIDHEQSLQPVVAHHPAGSRVPAHATAAGQAIVAFLPEIADRIALGGLLPHTDQTITDSPAFAATMSEIRERGYAVNIGQLHRETAGVAAPIFDLGRAVVGSVGISGPTTRIGRRPRLEELARLAVAGALTIETRLAAGAAPQRPRSSAAADE